MYLSLTLYHYILYWQRMSMSCISYICLQVSQLLPWFYLLVLVCLFMSSFAQESFTGT